MEISYSYTKLRKHFGRQPRFCEVPVHFLDTIVPDRIEQQKYFLRNPVHRDSQCYIPKSEHSANTRGIHLENRGVNHTEGGWPKEINCYDEEATSRYRRRIERDDEYVSAILNQYNEFAHYINQNNGTEMYEMYFAAMNTQQPVEKYAIKIKRVFTDPENRTISSIAWTFEDSSKIAVSYCDRKYPILEPVNTNTTCYIWDIDNSIEPYFELNPPTSCWQIACSSIQPTVFIGGLNDGRVCMFDIREKKEPVVISPAHVAHRDPVNSILYISSRLNTEFFSGSSDGTCKWWDVRNIAQPTDMLIMALRTPPGQLMSMVDAEGVSVLQFDRAFPMKFLAGTDTGLVINVNRKGKTYQEIISSVIHAHYGAVKSIQRSPCSSKIFMTCGDWTINIWNEDIIVSPIIRGKSQRYQINDVTWAPHRLSSYMSVSSDGKFRFCDLLRKYFEPIYSLKISKYPLVKLKSYDDGRFVALGDTNGAVHLLSLSDSLVLSADKDKQLMLQIYERESRREHILETRIKEIRLKLQEAPHAPIEIVDEETLIKAAEDDYKKVVAQEIGSPGPGLTSGIGVQLSKSAKRR